MIIKIKNTIKNILEIPRVFMMIPLAIKQANLATYYPEYVLKHKLRRIVENIIWLFRYHEINEFYQQNGQDCIRMEKDVYHGYMDYYGFRKQRDFLNNLGQANSQAVLLRDKFLFYKYLTSFKLSTPEVFGVLKSGTLLDIDLNHLDINTFSYDKEFFVKDSGGQCGSYVKKISTASELKEAIKNRPENSDLLFQEKIEQCDEMNMLNPGTTNTLRIVTVLVNDKPKVFSCILRIGTKTTGDVDNWSKGGIAIGVNKDGTLKEYGFMKPPYGLKIDCHPETGIRFADFIVPKYDKVCKLVCLAHNAFYNVSVIGWDVAITDNGPTIIEGNDNFELGIMQVCNEGYKNKWKNLMEINKLRKG